MYGTSSGWRVPGYTEIRELGAGAGGRVVMARHDVDGVPVAIKYLSDELRSDVGFVARFRHEARVLNTLDSPHAVRLYDYVETGEGAAIVMELVNGVALRAILRSEGPTGPEAALVVLKGALLGLSTAHTAGVVHRDFKPENVMVEADGASKLVDFGIAIRSGDGDTPAGTPPYMAPEQWTGSPAGPSTDVYAATVVFFECLTGTRPFRATNVAALARQHQVTPPPVEEVPPALQGLVDRGLAKHPADRPPTAAAFITELEAVAADAYGTDWQEKGRRRLAGLAALLPALFPVEAPKTGTGSSVAETNLRSGGARRRTSSLSKMGVKVLVGLGCVAVVGGVTAVLVNSASSTAIAPQSLIYSASPDTPESLLPENQPDDPTPEPSEKPAQTTSAPTPTPTPATTTAASPPPVYPTRTAAPSKTPKPKPSATPTKKPTKAPTPKPTPTVTDTEEPTSPIDSDVPTKAPSKTPTPTPTPTPTRTTAPPTPTTRPTRTPTPTPTPTPTETSTDGGGTAPTLSASPTPPETIPETVLAFGLVTGGTLPITLAMGRRMAGRHRRRR
ncbi:serine/threonine-protein kinase [Streptosporangium saharense]|uniref:Serine/threonine-protein kinase n=1 Tax=Streptosporangium saharense TaxID=1706840 RepID=A0A7W7QUN5_9ACTN|nr:serine/threonine-protein kinase [Streptosporangium saharense]MBB4920076.1 serine/threonine-protein kinase [Streptosporangium saharense]